MSTKRAEAFGENPEVLLFLFVPNEVESMKLSVQIEAERTFEAACGVLSAGVLRWSALQSGA